MSAWLIVALLYTVGGLLLVAWEELGRLSRMEWLVLIGWPAAVPVAQVVMRVKRWRRTCRTCGNRYATREIMLRHRRRGHDWMDVAA